MSVQRFRQIPATGHYVSLSQGCAGCSGCGSKTSKVELPVDVAEISLSCSTRDLYRLLVNSLVKPLVALIVVIMICDLLNATESLTLFAAVLGFGLGVGLCRPMTWQVMKFNGEELC